jgi:O-antigen biosynthesis protein WbqP
MKRSFDFLMALILIILLILPIFIIVFIVRLSSKGPAIYWSDRVGKNNKIFKMPKFRTMQVNSPSIATHLMKDPTRFINPVGSFLRRFSLDEIPQLFSIIKGDMTFVGPRPALFNQFDLIELRCVKGVDKLVPGVTGWAQINGRDELSIADKVKLDVEYLNHKSFWFDTKILWKTFIKVVAQENISH